MSQRWKLVPVEPTREMCLAARTAKAEYPIAENADSPVVCYRAMLAAAPEPLAGADSVSQQYVLRAMASNYRNGHSWDHLDGEAVNKAADEIVSLLAENAALQQRLTTADQRADDLQSVVEQVLTNAERGLPPDLHRTLRKLVPEPVSTQPVDEAEREPFEAWHRRRFKTKYSNGAPTRDIHGSVPDPNYGPPNQQQMWEAWNARAALLIPHDHEIPGTSFQRLNALANEGE